MEHAPAGHKMIGDKVDWRKHDKLMVHDAGVFYKAAAVLRVQAVDLSAGAGGTRARHGDFQGKKHTSTRSNSECLSHQTETEFLMCCT